MIFLNEINSTNTFLKELSRECDIPHGFMVRSDFQTSGHGQALNHWESERGKNILCSLLLRPENIKLEEQFFLSKIICLAIVETLQELINDRIEIKWPNDIYIGDKKVCGILIENTILGSTWAHSIVGIGININQKEFVSDAPNPISIKQITDINYDIEKLCTSLHHNIIQKVNELSSLGNKLKIKEHYMSLLYRGSGFYPYEDSETGELFNAKIVDIETMGNIILECYDTNLRKIYAFKEVKFMSI